MGVERNDAVLGQIVDQFHLIGFNFFLHIFDSFFARLHRAHERQIFLDDLFHLGFQLFEHICRKGNFGIKIVVKEGRVKVIVPALVNGRADGKFCVRIQTLDRLGQHMGGRVTVNFSAVLVLKR